MATFGNKISSLRKRCGLTQAQLAELVGYKSKSAINKIELGVNDIPRSKLELFAKALGASVSELVCSDNEWCGSPKPDSKCAAPSEQNLKYNSLSEQDLKYANPSERNLKCDRPSLPYYKELAPKYRGTVGGEGYSVGVNYWASNAGMYMWRRFDEDTVRRDLDLLAAHGCDTLRIFPLWPDFQPVEDAFVGSHHIHHIRSNDQPLKSTAGLDPVMLERFSKVLDLAEARGMKVIVALLTGWMSGRLFVPPLLINKNPLTDPTSIVWECKFIKEFINHFKDRKCIIAWEPGNECNCLTTATKDRNITHEQAELWITAISDAIRSADPTRPVWSGMYCNDLAGPWNVVMLSEHVDGQTTHPYPLFTPFCSMERLTDMRSALHSAAHTALFADTTEQPTLVEEIGTLGATVISDDYSPEYYEKSFWSSLQHGGTGFLWWCAFDQDSFDFPPYDGASVEQTLGLAYSDGTPKKIMKKMGEMAEAARALPRLSAKISDATVILTDPENAWKHTYGAFCLASQAGGAVDFMDRSRPLRKSKNYIIPSVEKDCALKFMGELICAVEGGARLLLTYGGGHLAPFERLTGLRVRGRETANKTFKAELFGKEISIKAEKSLSLDKGEAEVILRSGEDILLTKHKLGLGEVWFLNAPIETAYTTTYSPEKTNLHLIYKLFLGDEKPLSLDTSLASLTYHTQKDKKTIFVLITRFDERDEIPFILTKGYAIKSTKYCYIDNNTIHFDKFYAVVELEKILEI